MTEGRKGLTSRDRGETMTLQRLNCDRKGHLAEIGGLLGLVILVLDVFAIYNVY